MSLCHAQEYQNKDFFFTFRNSYPSKNNSIFCLCVHITIFQNSTSNIIKALWCSQAAFSPATKELCVVTHTSLQTKQFLSVIISITTFKMS